MKKLGLVGIIGIAIVIAIAIFTAGKMGQTSAAQARGKVVLDEPLKTVAQGIGTLFIIVYDPARPMPYGALRHSVSGELSGEIYDFALTNESVQRMMPDLPWPKAMRLKARLDRDGSAGPDMPGDLVGELTDVPAGAKDLVLKIDRLIE